MAGSRRPQNVFARALVKPTRQPLPVQAFRGDDREMSDWSLSELQDLGLYAFYRIYKEGRYEERQNFTEIELCLPEIGEFETQKVIEGLTTRKLLRKPHKFSDIPEITAKGIMRVENEQERNNSLLKQVSNGLEFFAREEKRTFLTIEAPIGEENTDLSLSILKIGITTMPEEKADASASREIPASNRIVTLDHNSAEYKEAVDAIDRLIFAVDGDNEYGAEAPEEKHAIVSALRSGRNLLFAAYVRVSAVRAILLSAIQYVADHFTKGAVTALGATAVAAVLKLIGVY